jgi:hypothetical protein
MSVSEERRETPHRLAILLSSAIVTFRRRPINLRRDFGALEKVGNVF